MARGYLHIQIFLRELSLSLAAQTDRSSSLYCTDGGFLISIDYQSNVSASSLQVPTGTDNFHETSCSVPETDASPCF